MKPFDLEKALAGEPVVTREGKKVEELVCFKANILYPVKALIDRCLVEYTKEGKFYTGDKPSCKDLLMAPTQKEGWVNVYKDKSGTYAGQNIYDTEQEAREGRTSISCYMGPAKITWEE